MGMEVCELLGCSWFLGVSFWSEASVVWHLHIECRRSFLLNYPLQSLFDKARDRKILKSKYGEGAGVRRSTFTPIIASCEGIFDHEAHIYMKRMSTLLASKWGRSYSQVHGWLKARMQVCILRSVSLCIQASRTQWRGAGIEHGAQISLYSVWVINSLLLCHLILFVLLALSILLFNVLNISFVYPCSPLAQD